MSANSERRARIMNKWYMTNRDNRHRSTNPAIDADEASLRLTSNLSPGAMRDPTLASIIYKYVNGPFTIADYPLLFDVLDYDHSDLPRRRMAPWKADGYSDDELVERTESRWLTKERVDSYGDLLASAGCGRAGQVEAVLHGKGAPTVSVSGGKSATVVFPIMPNPIVDGSLHFDFDEPPSVTEETEPDFAWPVSRVVIRLMSLFATQCLFCSLLDERLRSDQGAYPNFALVVGRGQRIHIFPACTWCWHEIERPYYDRDDLDPNALTFMGNDGFLAQVGHPEQKWY